MVKLHKDFDGSCVGEHERCFIQSCLSVINKKSQLVPFVFNSVQSYYEKVCSDFDFILKSRKLGMSTRIIGGDIWACAFKPNQHAVMLTHTDEAAHKMMEERIKPILSSSVVPLGAQLKLNEICFPQTNSRYYIGTAGTRTFGRGDDITRYHLSEYAHWENPSVITGVEEACVDNAVGRIETTANGTNFAQLDWNKALNGRSRYKAIFIPWYFDPEYSIAGAKITNPTQEELTLMRDFSISHEQLAWRREKIRSMSRPELFPQEYPTTPEEAFLGSGRMVFDSAALAHHGRKVENPAWIGDLRDMGSVIELVPGERGFLKVWEGPATRHQYVIGADVAEGIKDGAYSAAFVLDANTGRQVAEWHGHISPDRFGDLLVTLGLYYNSALLVPEAWPGPGAVTMARILSIGYRNVFYRDGHSQRSHEQLAGWETNQRTKPMMIHAFGAALRDYQILIKSKELLLECRSYEYKENGEMAPAIGCFSDRVIAGAIAWSCSRDIAARASVEQPHQRLIDSMRKDAGRISIPQWRGPRCGVRAE